MCDSVTSPNSFRFLVRSGIFHNDMAFSAWAVTDRPYTSNSFNVGIGYPNLAWGI